MNFEESYITYIFQLMLNILEEVKAPINNDRGFDSRFAIGLTNRQFFFNLHFNNRL